MLGGNARRLKLAYSLMFALPGTPVFWYGEEIGMGDDLSLPERNSVRTPMQWSDETNGGFSTAPPDTLVRPVVSEGAFGYRRVNVAAQRDLPGSLMEDLQRLVRVRRACPEVGWGTCTVLPSDETSVLALRYDWEGDSLIILHNLSNRETETTLPVDDLHRLRPLFGSREDRDMRDARGPIALDGYGYQWLRARGERR
jgi:maltose alpha-D-glucosyltransferase/alpha-amylase